MAGHVHGPGGHGHAHSHRGTTRALGLALALTASFMVVEFVAGHLTGSLALLADAGHMLSDVGSLSLALFATWIARRPPSANKTYGYKRFEVLAALANGVLLGVAAVIIGLEAHERWHAPRDVHGVGVIAVGVAGLVINLVSAAILHERGRHNVNVRAAMAHVLADALGSCAAIVAGLVVFFTGETRADPLLSVVVATILLWGASRLVGEAAHILMEGTPQGFNPAEVERTIQSVEGVASVHDLHLWSITSGEPALTAHVVLQPGHRGEVVARSVAAAVESAFHIHHCTIQPEAPPAGIVQLRSRAPTQSAGS